MWHDVNLRDTTNSLNMAWWDNTLPQNMCLNQVQAEINSDIEWIGGAIFQIFGQLMSQKVKNLHIILSSFNIHSQPHLYPIKHILSAWKLWQQLLVYGQQDDWESFASLRQFLTKSVCDSLQKFWTAGTSQTVCDCLVANLGVYWCDFSYFFLH